MASAVRRANTSQEGVTCCVLCTLKLSESNPSLLPPGTDAEHLSRFSTIPSCNTEAQMPTLQPYHLSETKRLCDGLKSNLQLAESHFRFGTHNSRSKSRKEGKHARLGCWCECHVNVWTTQGVDGDSNSPKWLLPLHDISFTHISLARVQFDVMQRFCHSASRKVLLSE